jgi:hypothetical protein
MCWTGRIDQSLKFHDGAARTRINLGKARPNTSTLQSCLPYETEGLAELPIAYLALVPTIITTGLQDIYVSDTHLA